MSATHRFPAPHVIELERFFAAPPERVWAAWTHRERVDAWWGPDGYVTTTTAMDVRVGGAWIYTMAHEVYGTYPNRVRYQEIEPPQRLVYLHDAGVDDDSAFRVTVTFAAADGGTRLTMRTEFPTVAACDAVKGFGAVELGKQTLAHLADHLEA